VSEREQCSGIKINAKFQTKYNFGNPHFAAEACTHLKENDSFLARAKSNSWALQERAAAIISLFSLLFIAHNIFQTSYFADILRYFRIL